VDERHVSAREYDCMFTNSRDATTATSSLDS